MRKNLAPKSYLAYNDMSERVPHSVTDAWKEIVQDLDLIISAIENGPQIPMLAWPSIRSIQGQTTIERRNLPFVFSKLNMRTRVDS